MAVEQTSVLHQTIASAARPRRVAASLGAVIFLLQVALGIMLFPIFQDHVPRALGAGDAWGGILLAAYGLARFLSETPTGAISDHIERKFDLLIGLSLFIPAVALMAVVDVRWVYLPGAALLGLGTAFFWPATYAISADLFAESLRGKVVGFLNVCQLLGFGLGALIGAFLVGGHPRVLMAIAVAVVACSALPAALGIPRYRLPHHHADAPRRPPIREVWSLQMGLLCVLVLLATAGPTLIIPAIRPFGTDHLGVSFTTVTVALIPGVILGGALYIPAGHLADRAGRMVPFVIGEALVVAGMLTVSGADSVVVAATGGALIFCGYVFSVPAFISATMDLVPESHRGTLIGLTVALTGLGLAIGPGVGGALTATIGAPATFRVGGIVSAATCAAVLAYARRYRTPAPSPPHR
jgi:MFS family permease